MKDKGLLNKIRIYKLKMCWEGNRDHEPKILDLKRKREVNKNLTIEKIGDLMVESQ